MRTLGCATLVLSVALAGCDEPIPPSPQLWTLFDVQALYAAGVPSTDAIALDAGLPGGVPLDSMLVPADPSTDPPTPPALAVQTAWAEAYPAAYVTTEVWAHFDEIWAQPMYVPVTGWDTNGVPARVLDSYGAWHPIFSVGPKSLFYSPFWQMIEVKVPEGTPFDGLTSVAQILDGPYVQRRTVGWVAALVPGDVVLDTTQPTVGGGLPGVGWLDGNPISFIKFTTAPFTFDADQVIAEVPIFHFVFAKDDGSLVAPDIPPVLGTGPLYSNTPPPLDNAGLPTAKYSAYWRVYTVTVPAAARVFAPDGSNAATALGAKQVSNPVPMYGQGDEITSQLDVPAVKDYLGRVALAPGCFAALATAIGQDNACKYLDSQEVIEKYLPAASIARTDVTVTCPLVSVNGKAVGQ